MLVDLRSLWEALDQIWAEDAGNQPEDQDEDFGFTADPLSADAPIVVVTGIRYRRPSGKHRRVIDS